MQTGTDYNALEARRRKREERREKQRQENVGRARKMHELRVQAEHGGLELDFQAKPELKRNYYIGCSGWFYWHWRGKFYSEDLPTNKWFDCYARQFNTVELNAPFYSWPTATTVKSWVKQLGRKEFVYTVKVCELITHTKKFRGTKELVKDFGLIADLLGPRMGCFLFQLPPSFQYTPTRLETILDQLDARRRNVVEFRHASWWNDTVYKAFARRGAIFCSCSGPRLPDVVIRTADEIYVRFHGPKRWYRHDYSEEELELWTHRIRKSGAKRVWAYFNNDREGYAITNAKCLRKLVQVFETTEN